MATGNQPFGKKPGYPGRRQGMSDMKGKRVVMTGCSRGVGYESCKKLLAAGAEVIGVARDAARLDKASAQLKALGPFEGIAADLADPATPAKIAAVVQARWDALDVLANNAGVQTWSESWLTEDEGLLERDLDINVLGPHRLARALVPFLLKGNQPRLVNVSSGAGQRKVVDESKDMPAYRISKMAVNALTLAQAKALEGRVAVNSLDPGWLKTDLGGPQAPGEPADGGDRMMEILTLPFEVSGKFFHGKDEIDF